MQSLTDALTGDPTLALALGAAAAAFLAAIVALMVMLLRRRPPAPPPDPSLTLAPELARLAETLHAVKGAGDADRRALEARLDALGGRMAETGAALSERLAAVDRAQANIEKLSGNVLGLQDILTNNPARGAFGETQLQDLVASALPPSAYGFQTTLSNGVRVDALIRLPDPPGAVPVDAKYPLDAYRRLIEATDDPTRRQAASAFRASLRERIREVAKYVEPPETADGAILFLPSEAVFAEAHARFPDVVREGFEKRVWIVSPTTLMATLVTMRAILRDAKLQEQSGDLRRELGLLGADVRRLAERAGRLAGRFDQIVEDVRLVHLSADKAAKRLEAIDQTPEAAAEAAE